MQKKKKGKKKNALVFKEVKKGDYHSLNSWHQWDCKTHALQLTHFTQHEDSYTYLSLFFQFFPLLFKIEA